MLFDVFNNLRMDWSEKLLIAASCGSSPLSNVHDNVGGGTPLAVQLIVVGLPSRTVWFLGQTLTTGKSYSKIKIYQLLKAKRLFKIFILNNKIQIFNNCKMVNQFKKRLPHYGLYNFVNWITQGPLAGCWNDYYLWQNRSHASVKQLGQPVSISMILKYCKPQPYKKTETSH